MQTGQVETGMQTFNQSLARALSRNLITLEDALRVSPDPNELKRIMTTIS